ncbi:M23 family metallopeptidase [Inquilinus sp. CAU 1745]|uniref:M23 family metallopeptidase n=1 Tax=Inquilinus sp. CAU 1745 TaxID=3140369 RepID=UPI00325B1865
MRLHLFRHFRLAAGIAVTLGSLPSVAQELAFPADCAPGQDCFVQQYPDMAPGPEAVDPFCGTATYDGHDGVDLRLLSMTDVARGVPVLAMADGRVLRWRDEEPDRPVLTADDRAEVGNRECGNGAVIDHGEGIEIQYCHLRQGSLAVRSGDIVREGDKIGEISASGLAQFPHLHVTIRKEGRPIDPLTGRMIGEDCGEPGAPSEPLFSDPALEALEQGRGHFLAFGLAGSVVDHSQLVLSGPPPRPSSASPALVGWAWLRNLHEGDQVLIEIADPSGGAFVSRTTEALDRPKATYTAYAGRRGAPLQGAYRVTVKLIRNGEPVSVRTEAYRIE